MVAAACATGHGFALMYPSVHGVTPTSNNRLALPCIMDSLIVAADHAKMYRCADALLKNIHGPRSTTCTTSRTQQSRICARVGILLRRRTWASSCRLKSGSSTGQCAGARSDLGQRSEDRQQLDQCPDRDGRDEAGVPIGMEGRPLSGACQRLL